VSLALLIEAGDLPTAPAQSQLVLDHSIQNGVVRELPGRERGVRPTASRSAHTAR
jgi:hypothetical protein